MEKQFSREDAAVYLKLFVSNIWSLLLILFSLPTFFAILGITFGQKTTTFTLLLVIPSVSMMILLAITYLFIPKIIARRMSKKNRWYLIYLKYERELHARMLRFEVSQFKWSKSLKDGAEMLIDMRNDPEAQKKKHIKDHQQRLLEIQKEMGELPQDDPAFSRKLDTENNQLLDELIRLNSLPENPDDRIYREHWSSVAVNAHKRAENYRLRIPQTTRSLAVIDGNIAQIPKSE